MTACLFRLVFFNMYSVPVGIEITRTVQVNRERKRERGRQGHNKVDKIFGAFTALDKHDRWLDLMVMSTRFLYARHQHSTNINNNHWPRRASPSIRACLSFLTPQKLHLYCINVHKYCWDERDPSVVIKIQFSYPLCKSYHLSLFANELIMKE